MDDQITNETNGNGPANADAAERGCRPDGALDTVGLMLAVERLHRVHGGKSPDEDRRNIGKRMGVDDFAMCPAVRVARRWPRQDRMAASRRQWQVPCAWIQANRKPM